MLIKKILLLTFIVLVIGIIGSLIADKNLPTFWGNTTLTGKLDYIKKNKSINFVFIGSSKTENQINIQIFDSTTKHKTRSFNLGCKGLMIPESLQLLDKILDDTAIKYIVYEIRCVYHIKPENLHITRTTYCETWSGYATTIFNTIHSLLSTERKLSIIITHTICFIEHYLNFSFIQGFIGFKKEEENKRDYEVTHGFDIPDTTKIVEAMVLEERKQIADFYLKDFYSNKPNSEFNHYYQSQLQLMINKAKANNKKLIFMLPSSMREFEYKELFPILNNLKNIDLLLMCDGNKFPELYEAKNNLEADHYNKYGTEIFSQYLGQEFNKLNTNKN